VVPFESLGTVSYTPSIITMAVSLAISEIFSVKEWPGLKIWVCFRAVSYSPSIVTMALVSFARYSDLLLKNLEIFIPHLYLAAPQGVTPSEFREDVWC